MHFIKVQVEGFDLQKLLSLCLKEGVALWDVRVRGDMIMTLKLDAGEFKHFKRLAGNRYLVTVIEEKGIEPLFRRIIKNRLAMIGVALFILLLYYQSLFVSEIRIYGYETLTEREIREELANAGLYEGCMKSLDIDQVEIQMYRQLEAISWIGIDVRGNLAEVTLVEGRLPVEEEDVNQPCHIVAAKEGYIEKIIAREGKEVVVKDDFVHVGDILISGIIPIEDKTYTQDPENPLLRYVHANGEVYAKTIYRFTYYQEKDTLHKKPTGRNLSGINLQIGELTFNTADLFWPYDSAIYEEKELFKIIRPIPLKLAFNRQLEVELWKEKRGRESIEDEAGRQAREAIKQNIQDPEQIINKSLKFSEEENIIEVIIMIEALEQIGKQQKFIPAADNESDQGPEGGNEPIGESTNRRNAHQN